MRNRMRRTLGWVDIDPQDVYKDEYRERISENSIMKETPFELFNMNKIPTENGKKSKWQVEYTNKISWRTKISTVSDIYNPIMTTDIIKTIVEQDYWEDLSKNIKAIRLGRTGILEICFNEMNVDMEVLANSSETTPYIKNLNLVRKEMGAYNPRVFINNSMDKSRAISLNAGLFRLLCSNGLIALDYGLKTKAIKHYKSRETDILNDINEMVFNLPSFVGAKTLAGMADFEITSEMKDKFSDLIDTWYDKKKETKAFKDARIKNHIESVKAVSLEAMDKATNLLDIENVLSYGKRPTVSTPVRNMYSSIETQLKKAITVVSS